MNILGLTIDTSINITAIGGGIIVLIGGIGSYNSIKFKLDSNDKKHNENKERFSEIEDRLDEVASGLNETKLVISERYSKKEEIREMESRIRDDINKLEHTIRNLVFGFKRGSRDE